MSHDLVLTVVKSIGILYISSIGIISVALIAIQSFEFCTFVYKEFQRRRRLKQALEKP